MKTTLSKIPKIKIHPKVYKELPENPGVYIYFKENVPIYIGKANNLKSRVSSYFSLNLEPKTAKMISEAEKIGYVNVSNDFDALLLEAKLIKTFKPKYNIVSKDDKHPLYIVITNEEFSRIVTARKNDLNVFKSSLNFGPFPSTKNVKTVLKIIRRAIPFSDHKIGKRPCIYSQIGLCNPCPNEIINNVNCQILKKIYIKNIKQIKNILEGNASKMVNELEKKMVLLSNEKKYEDAAEIRDKINKLNYIISPKLSIDSYLENPNLTEDIVKKELSELKNILNKHKIVIKKLNRIECFDVAHIQGSSATASMVTFINGVADKSQYRHFKIKQMNKRDDYQSMKEVANRRKNHFIDWGVPDLIIVDGGKGQLSFFKEEFLNKEIKIVGIAKKLETLVMPVKHGNSNTFIEYKLPRGNALNLVQRIRNEAHRFAQSYHHKLFISSLFETTK